MKKRLFTLCFALTAVCASTMAQFITEENFPDPKFQTFLIKNIDGIKGDRFLSESEKNAVTTLDVSNQGIKDLTGIEYFTKLKVLLCYGNDIKGADMYKLVNSLPEPESGIGFILVNYAGRTPDNVMTKGQVATAQDRGWFPYVYTYEEEEEPYDGEDLTVSAKFFPDAKFRSIVAAYDTNGDNILSDTELGKVNEIKVNGKGITDLTGIEHFYNLLTLNCSNNSLTALDVWNNKYLETLDCSNNNLTALDLTNNEDLMWLACYGNNISGTAMDRLVTSLPQIRPDADDYGFLIVCNDQCDRDNTITTAQIKTAMGKDWRAYDEGSGLTDMLIKVSVAFDSDANFQAYVASNIDTNGDGYLSIDERKAVKILDVSEKSISNLSDVKYFTELTELKCKRNNLTQLNPSANTKLKKLYCSENNLMSLDVSKNTALTELYCSNNSLGSLDVSKNTALIELYCDYNSLTSLDVSKNTALWKLYCYRNSLQSLDVSKNTALKVLSCELNSLTSLDVSKNTALTLLDCRGNQIKGAAMDNLVNGLPNTGGTLYACYKNFTPDNVITVSQVRVATGKGWAVKIYEGDSYVDYAGVFEPVAIDATNFPDPNFRNYLLAQDYGKDAVLTEAEILAVTELNVSNKGIKDLKGIEHFTALTKLVCTGDYSLKSLDVSNCTSLNYLDCSFGSLESLDVSKNTALKELYCNDSGLKSLDVTKNTALTILSIWYTGVQSLDLSSCTELTELTCGMSGLRSLDVSKNKKLKKLYCDNNGWTSLDLSNSTSLTLLYCYGNEISGAAMTSLVNSLPKRASNDGILMVCADNFSPDNFITPTQVNIATGKGWKVEKIDSDGNFVDYAGEEPIAIDATNFPDDNFRNYLLAQDYGKDGFLTEKEIKGIRNLDDLFGKGIKSLVGIEHFTALENLECDGNSLESLDVSKNTALTRLSCSANSLTSLDVSKNTALTILWCHHNNMKSLDVSNCLLLGWLNCSNNSLTSLVVSNISILNELDCSGNQISGAAMTQLVNSLPTKPSGEVGDFYVCYDHQIPDNIITAAQVMIAKGKGWEVFINGDIKYGDDYGVVYAGQGDVNCDNKINQDDLDLIVKIIMGKRPDDIGEYAGDLNMDGKTDAADIVVMVNILNGK